MPPQFKFGGANGVSMRSWLNVSVSANADKIFGPEKKGGQQKLRQGPENASGSHTQESATNEEDSFEG